MAAELRLESSSIVLARGAQEISNIKHQISNNFQTQSSKSQNVPLRVLQFLYLVIGICLGFGAWDFGFAAPPL
jgi:hypothetical protein